MKPYSEDLRVRIVRALQEGGMSKSGAARLFEVSLSSVKRYARLVEQHPTATISERRRFLQRLTGKRLSDSTIRRVLKRLGFSQKNGQWGRWNGTSG